jgi:hypothetical protein
MRLGCLLLGLVAAVVAALVTPPPAGALRTGVMDPTLFSDPARRDLALDRTRAAGASIVRLSLYWRNVAPSRRPQSFDPTNPADPAYDWGWFDAQVGASLARGLEPIVSVMAAPDWAEGSGSGQPGTVRPSPTELGAFMRAASRRYRSVRYWQIWNEPNRDYFLMPQYQRGRIVSAGWYRAMVNAAARAVHAVDAGDLVVAGGLAPLGRQGKPAPMAFMRQLLCVSRSLRRTCNLRANPVSFNVWSHHPYTSGGPTHQARGRDNVSLGDLPEMKRLLRAAIRLGHVRSARRVGFWVTEFSWDTKPPDPRALAASLHARWTAEALYRMWKTGVGVVVWFRIQDDPMSVSPFQSGFYTEAGAPKRSLKAFRFPLVAFARRGGVYVWGQTPPEAAGSVVVELRSGGNWRRLGTIRAGGGSVFSRLYRTPIRRGYVRARFGASVSLPFSLTPVRDRYVNPFGCGGGIRC